jgi:ATP-dependent DNA ligase
VNADDVVLDGEIVKLDATGRLPVLRSHAPQPSIRFVAFDVLELNGRMFESCRSLRQSAFWAARVIE